MNNLYYVIGDWGCCNAYLPSGKHGWINNQDEGSDQDETDRC